MNFEDQIQQKIDLKTKPLKALGQLESIAFQIARSQNTLTPELKNPHLFVFAADHSIAQEGVSAYPSEVTYQMVLNFLNGGAAINVFCKESGIQLKVVDAGVKGNFESHPDLIIQKVAEGSNNMMKEPAMSTEQLQLSLEYGQKVVLDAHAQGCNVIAFGEMGIGNTSSSSLMLSSLFNLPIEELVGRGTGVNDEQLQHKIEILKQVQLKHKASISSPMSILQHFGGLEIAQMVGAMKTAFENNMLILIDGFIATAAISILYKENQKILKNAIFCHQSDEQAHQQILNTLNVKPILNLNLRVGEGTGCALAYPIIKNAVNFFNDMASFESANVSNKEA